jgi:hypothetical protein
MKNFTILVFLFIGQYAHSQGIGIGSTNPPHASAALDVNSTTKGFLVPRMTTAQRNAIASPSIGLQIFDTTTNSFWYFNGTAWTNVYVGNFSLPFNSSGSVVSPTDLFSITNTSSGDAIYGQSNSGRGVFGKSTSSAGVRGESSSNIGVYGSSGSNIGVYGTGVYGGFFENSSNTLPSLVARNYGSGLAADFRGGVYVSDNLQVDGKITVNSGKGIVMSNSATQQKVVRKTGSFSVGGLAVGAFLDSGNLNYENFGGIPTVTVGQVLNATATGEWYKIMIIPINVTATECQLRIVNVASDPVTFTGSWHFLIVGPE